MNRDRHGGTPVPVACLGFCQEGFGKRTVGFWKIQAIFVVFEIESILAFGLGASLVALAPLVRRYGNEQVGDSMSSTGKALAKRGIKVGVAVAGVATTAAQSVARGAAEAAESFNDLVAEARAEMGETPSGSSGQASSEAEAAPSIVTEVSLD
ncbi:MAG: hypothetical protein VKM17_06515 [Cyanobacteriota bacterium]|nr:hypothetical protein [Cyanobacteriota bacterium]